MGHGVHGACVTHWSVPRPWGRTKKYQNASITPESSLKQTTFSVKSSEKHRCSVFKTKKTQKKKKKTIQEKLQQQMYPSQVEKKVTFSCMIHIRSTPSNRSHSRAPERPGFNSPPRNKVSMKIRNRKWLFPRYSSIRFPFNKGKI